MGTGVLEEGKVPVGVGEIVGVAVLAATVIVAPLTGDPLTWMGLPEVCPWPVKEFPAARPTV